ncbi:MAG TPA: PepSY-like domain-containing protein [Paludibacter sp.]
MKKIIFSVLAFAAVMVSCSSNEDLAGVASVSGSTSASVAAYVAENYPATKIVSTTASGSTVTATLNTGETLSFSKAGSFIAYSNNSSEGLVADSLIVSDSIATDSVGRPHHRGGHEGHGGMGHHGEGPGSDSMSVGHQRHFENEIALDSLPTVINDYILANYAGNVVIHAERDTICQGAVIEVLVCVTTQEPIKLVFDAVGAYLFKAERIHYTDVPAEVSAAVSANYSTFKIKNRAEKFTLTDGTLQYKVFIQSKEVRKSVTFNVAGTVSCEK